MTTTVFSTSVINDGPDPVFSYAASGDSLIVNAGVTLSSRGESAVYGRGINGFTDLHATINGTILSSGWAPIDAFGSSMALTVGSSGRIAGANVMMFEASGASSVVNHGEMEATRGFGVVLADATTVSVENTGTIFGEVGAVEIAFAKAGSVATVVNEGLLEAGGGARDTVGGAGSNQAIYSDATTTTINNDGTIHAADKVGAGILIAGQTAAIDNSGTIDSDRYYGIVVTRAAALTIDNSGTIAGAKGSLLLTDAADTVTNDGHLDGLARLGGGNDVYHGENGHVTGAVWGLGGNDLLIGGTSADVLGGGSGADTLSGGAGADVLTGSTGADRLSGGTGDDVFRFATAGESAGDAIVASSGAVAFAGAGVAGGDRIDVSAIDANATVAGSQHFVFGTSQEIGRLWAVDVGDVTHIRGNVAGGAAPEFDLAINDGAGVHASDYAGLDFVL